MPKYELIVIAKLQKDEVQTLKISFHLHKGHQPLSEWPGVQGKPVEKYWAPARLFSAKHL